MTDMANQFKDPGHEAQRDLESYLTRNGWTAEPGGRIGALWSREDGGDRRTIGVPFAIRPDSDEYTAVIVRIARSEGRSVDEVEEDIQQEFFDRQHFRIADEYVIDDSVLLKTASIVLDSARLMIRAAATTARKPQGDIRSHYYARADEIASLARLSHTHRGSFVLPVVMPVDPSEIQENELDADPTEYEPSGRRVTRTLASAIAALDSIAIRPDKEPNSDGIARLVQSGVSRELVGAVRAIANDSGVHAFDTRFHWAPGLKKPGGLPEQVVIPTDADQLLGRVERRLRESRPDVKQTLSGKIIQVRHVPPEPLGEIAMQTIRNNRTVEVRITTRESIVQQAAEWFRDQRAVIVRGEVQSTLGKHLSIPLPESIYPLDELFVVKNDDMREAGEAESRQQRRK